MTHLVAPLALLLATQAEADPLAALQTALETTIAQAEPSVVAIARQRRAGVEQTTAVRGRSRPQELVPADPGIGLDMAHPDYLPMPGDFGSGVVVGDGGEILTAFHVVRGAAQLYVRAAGGQGFEAEVIAADPRSDLAVIAPVERPGARAPKLTPIPLGDAEALRKGSFLVLLGNPFHTARDGRASASWGILSNTTRRVLHQRLDVESQQGFRHQPTLLQLDARLNLGMSGGAVVNLQGELVGISTTGGNAEGFDAQAGYAIPIDTLGRRVVETLREGKEVEYGFLGIRLNEQRRNVVGSVQPGTPAAEGDLLVDDEIIAVNERPVDAETGLSLALSTAAVGRPVKLTVRRGDRVLEKSVFLSKYPVAGEIIATNRPAPWRGMRVDFTSILAGNTFSDAILDAMAKGSVSVVEVEPDSPAAAAGLRPQQIIIRVAGQPVRSPAEFARVVEGKTGPVELVTDRGTVRVK
jgi:S1-C subfamily serine protease